MAKHGRSHKPTPKTLGFYQRAQGAGIWILPSVSMNLPWFALTPVIRLHWILPGQLELTENATSGPNMSDSEIPAHAFVSKYGGPSKLTDVHLCSSSLSKRVPLQKSMAYYVPLCSASFLWG